MNNKQITEQTKKYLSFFPNEKVLSDKEQRELICLWLQNKDKKAFDKLIYSNRKIVVKQAHKFANGYANVEDLIQCGMIGLIKAIEKFNPQYECKFISYAVYWINSELINYFKKETVHNFKTKERPGDTLPDLPQNENPDNIIEHSSSMEQNVIDNDVKEKSINMIKEAFACLPEREESMVKSYFLENEGYKNCSCENLSKTNNISKQRVAVLLTESVEKLKRKVRENKNIKEFIED